MAPSEFLLLAVCLGATAPGSALEHPSLPSRGRPTATEVEPRARIRVRREVPPAPEKQGTAEASEDEDDEGTCGLPAEASAGQEATNSSLGLSMGGGQLAAEEEPPEFAGAPTISLSVNNTSPRGGDAIAGLLSTGRGAATEASAAAEEAAVDASDAGDDEETCSPPAEGADEQRAGHASASLLEFPGNSSVRAAENSSGVSLRVASGPQQQTVAAHGAFAGGLATPPPLPQSLQERLAWKHDAGAGLRGAPEAKQGDGGEGPPLFRRGLQLLAQGTVLAVLAKASHQAYTARTPKLPF